MDLSELNTARDHRSPASPFQDSLCDSDATFSLLKVDL